MKKRRLIFYNDSRHYHMYCYEPPMRPEDAWAPVDEIAGTGVDTLAYGLGLGPTMFHDTKAGEIFGSHVKAFSQDEPSNLYALSAWRAYENVMSLINRGFDPLELIIDRAHKKGLEFFGSLRTTHSADPANPTDAHNWQFRIDHPEWCLQGRGKHNFNWVHPEVRAERFALIEEAVNRYDMDGLEIDFVFQPFYFEDGEVERNIDVLTDFLRDARGVVQKAAEARGRSMALGARVLPTLHGNLAVGLDVLAWLEQGLIDFVVPYIYGEHQIDAEFPFEWLVEPAHKSGCDVYPALLDRVQTVPTRCDYVRTEPLESHWGQDYAGIAFYRAAAAAYWSRGADAIYLPWFKWPVGAEQRQILSEIHDPDLLREKTKHYVAPRNDQEFFADSGHGYAASDVGFSPQVPIELTTGLDTPGQTVRLFIADGPDYEGALLRVRLMGSTTYDSLTISLNGEALPSDTSRRTEHGGYFYAWLEYPLAPGQLHEGPNEIGVALHARPENLTAHVVLQGVEIIVTYPEHRTW